MSESDSRLADAGSSSGDRPQPIPRPSIATTELDNSSMDARRSSPRSELEGTIAVTFTSSAVDSQPAESASISHVHVQGIPIPSFKFKFVHLLKLQFLAFSVLEIIFIVFAWLCFAHPIPIPFVDFSNLSVTKSAFTTTFSIWHTMAVACGMTNCLESFSGEWDTRQERTDFVSTVCSGVVNRLRYTFRPRATKTFKAAFTASLALIILRTTGSSTITVSSIAQPALVAVASIHVPLPDTSNPQVQTPFPRRYKEFLGLAGEILNLETSHGATAGFAPQKNWIIPLPILNTAIDGLSVTYETDIVYFNHSCRWKAIDDVSDRGIVIGDRTWRDRWANQTSLRRFPSGIVNESAVIGLTPTDHDYGAAVSVFLFLGGNSSVPATAPSRWIDLSHLPTTDLGLLMEGPFNAPLATLLICNPQLHFTSGTVLLNPSPDPNTWDLTVLSQKSHASIGNIDQATVQFLFTEALSVWSLGPETLSFTPGAFLDSLLMAPQFPEKLDGPIILLDLQQLGEHVGDGFLSLFKAFTSGFAGSPSDPFSGKVETADSTTVRGSYGSARLGFATSALFAALHSALFVVILLALVQLEQLNSQPCRVPFDLEHLERTFSCKHPDDGSQFLPRTTAPTRTESTPDRPTQSSCLEVALIELGTDPLSGEDVTTGTTCMMVGSGHLAKRAGAVPEPMSPNTRFTYLLNAQFLSSLLLEVAFVAFTWVCFAHPIPLPSFGPSVLSIMRSVFTALFSVWHTIAVACGDSVCLEWFSKEWAALPQRTDAVSTLCSGIRDRLTYATKSRATRTFRCALSITLCLMILRTSGSSAIILNAFTQAGFVAVATLNASPLIGSDYDASIMSLEYDKFNNFQTRQIRTMTRLNVEQTSFLTTGYRPEPNWLIPLPLLDLEVDETIGVTYGTDLVHFHHSCHWQAPEFDDKRVALENGTWSARGLRESLTTVNASTVAGLTPDNTATGVSAFLFLGGNSTATNTQRWLDLRGLPTSNLEASTGKRLDAPLATLLVCDPQLFFTSGMALLKPTTNPSALEVTVATHSPNQTIGNINPTTVRDLFTWLIGGLGYANGDRDGICLTTLGGSLFLPQWVDCDKRGSIPPLGLHEIEERLDNFTLSALKVYTSGYTDDPLALFKGFPQTPNTTRVNARFLTTRLALSTSVLFAVGHSVLFVITALGLAGLRLLNSTQRRVPFDLVNVEKELKRE